MLCFGGVWAVPDVWTRLAYEGMSAWGRFVRIFALNPKPQTLNPFF